MADIHFVDTTLRDGDQSLWGFKLTTGMILPIAGQLDRAGFESTEPDTVMNFKLRVQGGEEPWDRLDLLSRLITKTPLSLMSGIGGGKFNVVPRSFNQLRIERFAAHGVKRIQMYGFLNDLQFRIPETIGIAQNAGQQVVLGLVYTLSPKHTDEYYARKTREAVVLKPDRLYLKDPGGLLTPERTRTIIPTILENSGGLPVEIHSHCTTGLAPLCYLEAVKLGINILHTSIPPLANGPAQPSVFNIAGNARLLGHNPLINEEAVRPVADHFRFIALRNGWPLGEPLEYDYEQYLHQIPGGVITNLKRQLVEIRLERLFPAVIEETIRVREELGYPIMVTPFSQHVVTQATINVLLGERYQEVTDELIQYCLGWWGQEASTGVAHEIRDMILDRPRARELARHEPPDPTIEDIRQKIGYPGIADDELVARYMIGGDAELKAMRPARPIKWYPTARTPLAHLIEELARRRDLRYIHVKKGRLSLTMCR